MLVTYAQVRRALAGRQQRRPFISPFTVPVSFKESAVLVLLVDGPQGPALLLIVRQAALRTHASQVAFAGGKKDPEDADLVATALRETEEELGLHGTPEVVGYLDDVPSPQGYLITPVVALWHGPLPELQPNRYEIADHFLLPLCGLREAHQEGPPRDYLGYRFILHEFHAQGKRIWGATAAMIWQLMQLLQESVERGDLHLG